jgi:hypothetical protein
MIKTLFVKIFKSGKISNFHPKLIQIQFKHFVEVEKSQTEHTELKPEERIISKKDEKYTPEELDNINKKGDPVTIHEIEEKYKSNLLRIRKVSLYFNLPISFALFGINELFLTAANLAALSKLIFMFDYLFFLSGLLYLNGTKNIVIQAKYLPNEKAVEFTKFSFRSKPYVQKESIENLKRVGRSAHTPFASLKNHKTGDVYSMNGIPGWKDLKLFNTLFPAPVPKPKSEKDKRNRK